MKNLNNKTKKQLMEYIEILEKQIKKLEKDKSESQNLVGALQESEERQRTIFQSTGTAMVIVEEDKIISMANLQFEKLCGYSREEVEGKKTWTEFVVKDDLMRMKEYHRQRRISEDLSPTNYEFKFIDRKDHIKNILLNIAMIPGTKKSVASLLDITELKNAEKELRGSEARWKALSENSPVLIILQDKDGKILFINRPVSERTRKKVVGKSVYNFIPPGFHKIASDCFEKVWKTSKQCSYSTQLKTSEGKIRHFDVWVNPVFEEKEVVAIVSNSIDVSEKKLAEEAIKSSEERLKILFEYAPDAYYLSDLKGHFLDGNKAAENLLGYKKKELIGKSFMKLKPLSAKELIKAAKLLGKNIQGKPTGPDNFTLTRKDGSRIHVEIMTFPVEIKEETVVLGIARDITDWKKAGEELKKHRDQLEELVKERTEKLEEQNKELERLNKLFVGREFRIKELRDRVKELEGKAGEKR